MIICNSIPVVTYTGSQAPLLSGQTVVSPLLIRFSLDLDLERPRTPTPGMEDGPWPGELSSSSQDGATYATELRLYGPAVVEDTTDFLDLDLDLDLRRTCDGY